MPTAPELFQHFQNHKPQITINGKTYWVIEADLLMDEDHLWAYTLRRIERMSNVTSEEREGLVAMTDDSGCMVRWRPGKLLTYCVRRSMFLEDEYNILVQALDTATADWEAICGVKFERLLECDSPLFDVIKVDTETDTIASAFFPNDPPALRHVQIYPLFFDAELEYDRAGVMRHELGHVLGFRHEQIRSQAPADCPEEEMPDHIFDLTDYDPKSVMHYFCGGVGTRDMRLTEVDRQGARQLYGPPSYEVADFD